MDSSIVSDPRFKLVAHALDVKWTEVIGSCFLVWLACYERRSTCLRKIEADLAADLSGFSKALIDEHLADEMGDGVIRIHGVEKRIEFLLKQAESGAKGGKSKGKKKPKQSPKEKQAPAQAPASESAKANTPSPSPDLSPTPADLSAAQKKATPKSKANPDHQTFVDAFHQLFMAHTCGSKPSWRAKEQGIVKALLKAHGLAVCLERAKNMFEAPPPFPPPPFDLGTLSAHFDKFAARGGKVDTARDPTKGRVEPREFHEYPESDEDVTF